MKLFKSKKQVDPQEEYEYWKDPRLDDEGTYDYYACGKPDNEAKMCWSTWKCDDCGKEPRFKRYGSMWHAYWYCWDGWDGDSGFVCWKCLLKGKVHSWRLKKRREKEKKQEFKRIVKDLKLTKEQIKTIQEVLYNK